MTKRLLRLWGVLVVCGLVACQAAVSPTVAPTSTLERTSTSVPTSTPVPAAPTATSVPAGTKDKETDTTEAADAEPPWQIPRVSESDWTKGAAGAGLVVVEYSDFQ